MARQAYLYSTSLILRWMVRLNIGVLLLLFAASPIVVPIFFNIANASGTTYYVDNCVTVGNDSNNGTDPSTPWLTINKVNTSSFNPGDSILFRRTCTWREKLTVPSSGSAGSPITLGAYGSGNNPILTPSRLVTSWSLYSENIYNASYGTTAFSVWEDSTYLTQVGSLGALTAPGEWFIDTTGHLLYIWTLDGSSPSGHTIEAGTSTPSQASAISLTGISYLNIQDLILEKNTATTFGLIEATSSSYVVMSRLEVRYGGYQGYGVDFAEGSHNTIQDSLVHDIRNDGVYFRQSSTYDSVLRNTIYNIGQNTDAGDNGAICFGGVNGLSDYGLAESNLIYNVGYSDSQAHNHTIELDRSSFSVVRYNRIHDSVKGGIAVGGVAGAHITDDSVYNNLIYDINLSYGTHTGQAPGILVSNGERINVYNNTIWNVGTTTFSDSLIAVDGTSGQTLDAISVFNNILGPSLGSFRRNLFVGPNPTYTNRTSNNNLFYDAAGLVINVLGSNYTTLAAYKAGVTPQESNSLNADPLFSNLTGKDFTLQSSSPAIDAGTNLGAPYNMGLDPRTSFPYSTIDQGIYGSWDIGAFIYVPNLGSGNQAEPRYDFLNNSATTATSNHTLIFTVQNSLDNTGGSASDTLALTFQSNFDLSNITCGDVNVATGTRFLFNVASPEPRTNCPNTTTSWGLLVNSASRTITITVPASVKTYVATGTILTVSIGSNANYQNQGTHWIINPTDSGTKSITIGGTFGGYGQILVSVNPALQLSATVQETLTLTLAGLNGSGTGGMNSCSSNGTTDAEDSASINLINTTAASVPFGTLSSSNTFYEGCQKVSITTNAGNGYTVAVREDHSLHTASGLTIADTACDANGCLNTPSTAAAWVTNTNPGLGISCAQAATSASCWTANPNWINGTRWAPIANEGENNPTGGTETPAIFSGLTGATSVEVITKAKYRVTVPTLQAAGTYTNLVSFIATPVY
jgi:hypothetical protein